MGYILIIIGLAVVVWGITIVRKSQKTETNSDQPYISEKESILEEKSEPKAAISKSISDENKEKGDTFEKYIVKNFSPKYFTLQEWRSDKYVDGVYAVSNHFPDLEVVFELKSKGVKEAFAIECKWRKNYFKNGVEWAKNYQIENYKEYAEKVNIPVFVVIGMGGKPSKPNELFIVPLSEIKSNILTKSELEKYKKDSSNTQFFWDYENNELR